VLVDSAGAGMIVCDLTAGQAADLLAYLESLRD
jgi:hypothetical protein